MLAVIQQLYDAVHRITWIDKNRDNFVITWQCFHFTSVNYSTNKLYGDRCSVCHKILHHGIYTKAAHTRVVLWSLSPSPLTIMSTKLKHMIQWPCLNPTQTHDTLDHWTLSQPSSTTLHNVTLSQSNSNTYTLWPCLNPTQTHDILWPLNPAQPSSNTWHTMTLPQPNSVTVTTEPCLNRAITHIPQELQHGYYWSVLVSLFKDNTL